MSRTVLQLKNQLNPGDKDYEDGDFFLTDLKMHVPSLLATEIEFIKMVYWMIVAKGYKSILELGTNRGDATYWFLKAADKNEGDVVTVDKTDYYKGKSPDNLKRVICESREFFKSLSNETFDFIYVDGDHSYLGAISDMLNAECHIAPGGSIAIHDVNYDADDENMVRSAFEKYHKVSRGKWMTYHCGAGLAIGEF